LLRASLVYAILPVSPTAMAAKIEAAATRLTVKVNPADDSAAAVEEADGSR
jgi:hypothetical protein